MEQKKTLVIVISFPGSYPSMSFESMDTKEEFDELMLDWMLREKNFHKTWEELDYEDAYVLQDLMNEVAINGDFEDMGDLLGETDLGVVVDKVQGALHEFIGCEFLIRLVKN